ncbi:adenylate/guanylate cyclase domain-containing protein [Caballeronia novacaledonica]|uniref:AAA family ATPase n=1 Tax=Caballeronia novacaledonica TaxID=1544861 RepID=A0AA37IHT6_9BURK|nr:adenylate/guanylate cyclase domain-containing protein [Caballeronia novacaledonica]GJH30010.1 AAA family ATPase [Caballeronia novacaledonica]
MTVASDFPLAEDRREATAIFADISGYSTLCSKSDVEEVQAMLDRFYTAIETIIAHHGGQVLNRMGDAVMAVFGAPFAHGNDPERAIRSALEMHAAASAIADCEGRPLKLHIGVARGEVVVAKTDCDTQSNCSVTGEIVNLAARLQALAGPGETLISEGMFRSVATLVQADACGIHTLKGFTAPVAVWRVRSLSTGSTEYSPLVGRKTESDQIAGVLDRARDAGRGAVILVRGRAGIGKSRLMIEVRQRAQSRGFAVPFGQVLDFGASRRKAALPAMLASLLGLSLSDDNEAIRAGLERAMEREIVMEDDALFIAALLEVDLPAGDKALFESMSPVTRTQRSDQALIRTLEQAARVHPVLITIEDVHWAPMPLLRQLMVIAQNIEHSSLVLAMTERIEAGPLNEAWSNTVRSGPLLQIELGPLSYEELCMLASDRSSQGNEVLEQCARRAEGNPLFLEHLLRASHDSDGAAVPPTVQSLVLEQMDRLTSAQRTALQAASVIGRRFASNDLCVITSDPADHCEALVRAELIRVDGDEFQFTHALVQEAVYGSMLKARKRSLHRKVALRVGDADPVLRAEHLDRAEDPDAARAYLLAARDGMQHFHPEAAVALAQRGAALARDASVACDLALLHGELLRESGRLPDSLAAGRSALELATSDQQRCHALMEIAAGYRVTGAIEEALDALAQADSLAEPLLLELERSKIHYLRGSIHFASGDVPACAAEHRQALRHAKCSNNPEYEIRALSGLGDAQLEQGHLTESLQSFERCVELCEARQWIAIEIPNRCMRGYCLQYAAKLDQAVNEVQRALVDARRTGLVPAQVFALSSLATILVDAGRFDEAEAVCIEGLPLAREVGARRFESTFLLSLAEIQLRAGSREDAVRQTSAALQIAQDTGFGYAGAAMYAMLARAAPSAEARVEALRQGAVLISQPCLAQSILRFHIHALEATIEAGEWDSVLRHAEALEAFMQPEPLPWACLLVRRARLVVAATAGTDVAGTRTRLLLLRQEVVAAGLGSALRGIDTALERMSENAEKRRLAS